MLIHAQHTSLPAEPPEWLMWMPAGIHNISANRADGAPWEGTVNVTRDTAALVARRIRELTAESKRPYLDFDHEGKAASAWPIDAAWQDSPAPGVYVRVEWSKPGQEAIAGKTHRSFSPSFFVDASGNVSDIPLDMGGLVNDQAFHAMKPFFAAQAASHQTETNMSEPVQAGWMTLKDGRVVNGPTGGSGPYVPLKKYKQKLLRKKAAARRKRGKK